MAAPGDGYEWAVGRITEMEVDLANAISGLKRSQADNESLLANQADLLASYKRLQDAHERTRHQRHQEKEEHRQAHEEQQHQITLWRSQIELKDRDIEELQHHRVAPRELDAMHLQLAEEIEEPYRQQIRDLEVRFYAEQQRSTEARRQMEMHSLEQKHTEQELRDQLAEQVQRHEVREQALQRQISTLEVEVRTQMDNATGTWNLHMQVQEQEAKLQGLQSALRDQEKSSSQERKALADDVLVRGEELSVTRRRMHELQAELDSKERAREQLASEAQALGCEKVRLSAQLAEAKAQLAAIKPTEDQLRDELTQVQRTAAAEREQLLKRINVLEDQLQASQLASKHAEARARQLEEDQTEREREFQAECEEVERTHSGETSKLQAEVDKSTREAETRRLAWREKERDLTRQLETSSSNAEALKDDLEQCRASHEEAERRLQELRRDAQQRSSTTLEEHQKQLTALQTELATLRERAGVLERERNEHSGAAETARVALREQEQRADKLQAEVASWSQRLDTERNQWAREADEAQAAATRLEEERRTTATQLEEHKRQMVKHNVAYKKALQKALKKRQDSKQRCQELVKRITQMQQEKATAVRICEENKAAYETRLTELGLVSRLGLGSIGVGAADVVGISQPAQLPTVLRTDAGANGASVMHRRELRAIMERLEQNAERLRPDDTTPTPVA